VSSDVLYPVSDTNASESYIDKDTYEALYQRSIESPEVFWAEQAETFLKWRSKWHSVRDYNFHEGKASWFEGGRLNVSENCIDRHLADRADQVAIIWEGDEPSDDLKITMPSCTKRSVA